MDMEDDWDFIPFVAAKDYKKQQLEDLSRKSPSQLSPLEIFKLIDASISLDKCIPAALSLMEQGKFIDLDPHFLEDHWTLLERQSSYFKENPTHKSRLAHLKKVRDYRDAQAGKGYTSCFQCHDRRGEFKRLYETRDEAISSAEHRHREAGSRLTTYACAYKEGWHLKKT